MRLLTTAAVALGAALLSVPAVAAIKAMTLAELMEMNTDVLHVQILAKDSFRLDWPFEGAVYTRMTVEGESLQSGEPVHTDVVFLGSHDVRDQFGTSEMPTLQDTRVGSETIIFFERHEDMPGQPRLVHSLASVYRVEQGFGSPVVIGKGEGFAFPENIKLEDATASIRQTAAQLRATQAPSDK